MHVPFYSRMYIENKRITSAILDELYSTSSVRNKIITIPIYLQNASPQLTAYIVWRKPLSFLAFLLWRTRETHKQQTHTQNTNTPTHIHTSIKYFWLKTFFDLQCACAVDGWAQVWETRGCLPAPLTSPLSPTRAWRRKSDEPLGAHLPWRLSESISTAGWFIYFVGQCLYIVFWTREKGNEDEGETLKKTQLPSLGTGVTCIENNVSPEMGSELKTLRLSL